MSEPIIEINHANIYQGASLVLQDVNLRVNKGSLCTWWAKQEQANPAS